MRPSWRRAAGIPGLLLVLAAPVHADRGGFTIREFHTEVSVEPGSEIDVDERLVVDFSEPRHGLYRTIPVRYTDRRGFAYSMGFRLLEVVDDAGRAYGTKVTHEGRYVKIRIGDPDVTVSGEIVYRIRYRVKDALGSFPDHDELYWNATGHEWNTRIERATAVIRLPAALPSDSLETASYVGSFGEREGSAVVRHPAPGTVMFELLEPLSPLEGLTVVAAWPKGYVTFPGAATRAGRAVADNAIVVVPFLFLGLLYWRYARYGRDPGGPASVMVRYEPPEGVTPGEIGTLLDETVDLRDLTAVIIDLAVRGYLVIREEEDTFLFSLLKKKETVFERVRDKSEEGLLLHEKLVLRGIFESGDRVEAKELRQKYYKHLPGIRKALYGHLTVRGYFAGDPTAVRTRYQVSGVLAAIATVLIGLLWAKARGGLFPPAAFAPAVAGFLTLGVFLTMAPAMPRRTRAGVRMRSWALGFKEFVERVEKPGLSAAEARHAFEALLPYAMALGISSAWARRFEGIYHGHPPTWYVGPHAGGGFSTRAFEQNLSHTMGEVGRTLAASPRSSSGSGGGGFSGGGGGGGGGGSW